MLLFVAFVAIFVVVIVIRWRSDVAKRHNSNEQPIQYIPTNEQTKTQVTQNPKKDEQNTIADILGKNIGQKLKTFAYVCFVIECIGAVIAGIALFINDISNDRAGWIGLVTLFGGIAVAYIGFMFTYAFGELIETNQQIARNTKK